MPSVEFAEFGGRKVTFGPMMFQPRAGNAKVPQAARATQPVTKQIARKLRTGGGDVKRGKPAHYSWPAIDNVDENETTAGSERGFQPREGFGNVFEMMKRGVADNGIECFLQHELVGVGLAVFHVGCGALSAGDSEHGFGNVDGDDGIELFGEFKGKQTGAAAHVQHATTVFRQMPDKKIMVAFQRSGGVISFREVIEGFRVVCLHNR